MSSPGGVRKVLITGAAGYLGGFVVERLLNSFDLTLLDWVAPRAEFTDLSFFQCDISDLETVRRACHGQDAVVHMVAPVRERTGKPPSLFADVVVKGTWNVAQASVEAAVQRLVNISSIAINWPKLDIDSFAISEQDALRAPIPVDDPTHYVPLDLYYKLSKRIAEQICDAYHEAYGLSVIHLRPGAIAGDGTNGGPASAEARKWSRGRFFYVDPRDLAQSIEGALVSKVGYGRYAIVAGRRDSLFDWQPAAREIDYRPLHNWSDIPEVSK